MKHGYANSVDKRLFTICRRNLLGLAKARAVDPINRHLVSGNEIADD